MHETGPFLSLCVDNRQMLSLFVLFSDIVYIWQLLLLRNPAIEELYPWPTSHWTPLIFTFVVHYCLMGGWRHNTALVQSTWRCVLDLSWVRNWWSVSDGEPSPENNVTILLDYTCDGAEEWTHWTSRCVEEGTEASFWNPCVLMASFALESALLDGYIFSQT